MQPGVQGQSPWQALNPWHRHGCTAYLIKTHQPTLFNCIACWMDLHIQSRTSYVHDDILGRIRIWKHYIPDLAATAGSRCKITFSMTFSGWAANAGSESMRSRVFCLRAPSWLVKMLSTTLFDNGLGGSEGRITEKTPYRTKIRLIMYVDRSFAVEGLVHKHK